MSTPWATISMKWKNIQIMGGVWSALEELPCDYKQVLLLKYVYGYSENEMAMIFGIKYEAMRKRIQRAKDIVRRNMECIENDEKYFDETGHKMKGINVI